MPYRLIILLLLLCSKAIYAQNEVIPTPEKQSNSVTSKKKLNTILSNENILIDGELNEAIWQKAEVASNFIMFQPDNGKAIAESKKTEVKVLYDNEAMYIGATLNDEDPSKIMKMQANPACPGVWSTLVFRSKSI